MSKRKIVAILLVVFLVISAIGIYLITNHIERNREFGLFGEDASVLPCWWKICAGQTYNREYILSLINSDDNAFGLVENTRLASVHFNLADSTHKKVIGVDLPLISKMYINLDPDPSYQLTISQVINKIGYPEYVGSALDRNGREGSFILFYPKMGTIILTESAPLMNNYLSLSETLLVWHILITSDDFTNNTIYKLYRWTKWKGYGLISN
ncbi:MAG: hypothetical protein ACYCZF_11095 [Anaerolineae bacterium]